MKTSIDDKYNTEVSYLENYTFSKRRSCAFAKVGPRRFGQNGRWEARCKWLIFIVEEQMLSRLNVSDKIQRLLIFAMFATVNMQKHDSHII
jgi:hypothetical protein